MFKLKGVNNYDELPVELGLDVAACQWYSFEQIQFKISRRSHLFLWLQIQYINFTAFKEAKCMQQWDITSAGIQKIN